MYLQEVHNLEEEHAVIPMLRRLQRIGDDVVLKGFSAF